MNVKLLTAEDKVQSIVCVGLAANLAALIYYFYSLSDVGYLPTPFMPNKFDNFMDLFNTLYWSFHGERYTDWNSIYPPVVFLFLQGIAALFNISITGEPGEPVYIREYAVLLLRVFFVVYLIIPALVIGTKVWEKYSFRARLLYYLFVVTSAPMLFALDRGNIIILAPFLIAWMYSFKYGGRILIIAILINIKPYFAILLLLYAINGSWRNLWAAIVTSGAIYMVSGVLLDENFLNMLANIVSFGVQTESVSVLDTINFPSSISAFSIVLRTFENTDFEYLATSMSHVIDAVKYAAILGLIVATYKARTTLSDDVIMASLIIIICNSGISVGGYSLIFYYPIIPVLLNASLRHGRNIIALLMFSLYMPLDLVALFSREIGRQNIYLTDQVEAITWSLGAGSVLRPLINLAVMVSMIAIIASQRSKPINVPHVKRSLATTSS